MSKYEIYKHLYDNRDVLYNDMSNILDKERFLKDHITQIFNLNPEEITVIMEDETIQYMINNFFKGRLN
jgi:hypothetical protein